MKYILSLVLIIIVSAKISFAQKIELINSGEAIKKGTMLYDSGKYKLALSEYDRVNRSDTNYVWSVYEKARTCEADSQYSQAIKYCQQALSLKEQRDYEPELYNTYGNVLDDMGQQEKAIKVFDAGIAKYPAYSFLYFNKGVALLGLKRPADAELVFQQTLLIDPYMYSAHFQLGLAALQQGKIIPAFLSFTGYLLVNPEGKYATRCIKLLDAISNSTDEILDAKNKRTIQPGEGYQEVEDIVLSKIALDKAYKPIITLDDAISRQIQVVFEKMEYKETDNDFWIQYYLPYYKQVYSDGKFELFINHIFSKFQIPVIQDYVKRNKKELAAFTTAAAVYFDLIRASRQLAYNKRDTVQEKYFFDDGSLEGKGALTADGKSLTGHWELYYAAGNPEGRGDYNLTGKKDGDWVFYYYPGTIKAREHYVNGKEQGGQDYYFENGNLKSHEIDVDDNLEGIATTYFYNGNVKSTITYKAGKKDGEEKAYDANGNLSSVNNYSSGALNGESRGYYKSGQLKEIGQYVNGKEDGPYKAYYENGKLKTEGQYVKDNANGEFKYYYENGQLQEKRNYLDSKEDGAHEEHYDNGQLSVSYLAKKDKIIGEALYYDEDGKMYAKSVYDNGNFKTTQYFNKSGSQVSTSGPDDVISYTPEGIKKEHFAYNKKGDLEGPDTTFYPSGKISKIDTYVKGDLNGPSVSFYLNGNKKVEINMTDGKEDGLYTGYYVNGKTESTGWMVAGNSQGTWEYYDELGRLSTRSYYLDGDLNGYKEDYLPNGQKTTEEKYHTGWLEGITQYDNAGNVIKADSFPKLSGKYTLIYPGGQIMAQTNYVNGDFSGPYKTFYFDGKLESSFFYSKGALDSTYVSYYYSGVKSSEGRYLYGDKDGLWRYYDEQGKLSSSTVYVNDMMNGEKTFYYENGNVDNVSVYKDDELDGLVRKFDPDGVLAYQITFKNDKAKDYSYLGRDGKLVAPVPIGYTSPVLNAYYLNGKLSRAWSYSDGVKNGPSLIYYSNGQIWSADTSAYDVSGGSAKEYYPDGKLKSDYHYLTDNATGICREYYKNGNIKKEMAYENGSINGLAKYYDENGKLAKTMTYFYGTLISVKNE